jgi:aspartate beta-hydroxylase
MNSPALTSLDDELRSARLMLESGRVEEASQGFARAHQAAPDNTEALNFLGMQALGGRQVERAIQLLERAVALDASNPEFPNHLGLAYLAAQRLEEACAAFGQAIKLDPKFFIARLQYAHALEVLGREHEALIHYFCAITQAQTKGRWLSEKTTAPILRDLVKHAIGTAYAGRKKLFGAVLAPLRERYSAAQMLRAERCLQMYLGEIRTDYPDARQRPKFLYFPDLPTTPYFARDLFPWYQALEAATPIIRDELLAVLGENQALEPFLEIDAAADISQHLAGGAQGAPRWDAFFFYRHGVRYDDNCARCPQTTAILDSLPLVQIHKHAPEVCFSVLTPGTHILPHRGVTNTRLVTHLPLIVPEDCAINVGGELHTWQEGRCVTFDDTFEHEAWNRSQTTRVVLILDIWNPHLSEIERTAVSDLVAAISTLNAECAAVSE